MADNLQFSDGTRLNVACSHPAAPNSGDPVRYGDLTGVALTDEDSDGLTSMDMAPRVWDLSVKGVDDSGNSAVSAGDNIYYVDADTPVLSKKITGRFFGVALETVSSGATATIQVLHQPVGTPGGLDIPAGVIVTADIGADAVDGTKIADNSIDSEHYVDGSIDNEHYADGSIGAAEIADDVLDGSHAANLANDDTTPGLPVLYAVAIGSGAAADHDITIDEKIRVIDAWAVHTGGAGEASDTIQVKNGANAITDAMSWAGADNAIVRAATIDDANADIAAAGTLRVTTVDADAGTDVGAGICYILGHRVA